MFIDFVFNTSPFHRMIIPSTTARSADPLPSAPLEVRPESMPSTRPGSTQRRPMSSPKNRPRQR